jgi:hypothetical protein
VTRFALLAIPALVAAAVPAMAGPPYVTDDPQPTDLGHYEIYAFTAGTTTRAGTGAEAGIDLNYGAAPDLQLTAVSPLAYDSAVGGSSVTGLGEIELAAKYKFLHQEAFGIDVAFFPRVFLPTNSDPALGGTHPSFFFPFFAQKNWGDWSLFGGGGCTVNYGGDAQDFCQAGLVVTRQILPGLQAGLEIYHQTPDTKGGRHSSGIGLGAIYDLSENCHLMASAGPGLQNAAETNQATWYAALLFTY